ncbi:MAG: radical SAM protein [Deltaproteobacteria bacterium]|nr:radical SAM protein [Deltaproteobacteria bacterium]
MGRKKQLIIPIFIPFGGCPNQCVFCDQEGITGSVNLPSIKEVTGTIDSYLSTWKGIGAKEAAFYGGSFTGLPENIQHDYLKAASKYIKAGRLDSLRLSTRPDYISEEIACYLKKYKVEIVELGVQSMSDEVLRLSGRGHTSAQTIQAVEILKEHGIKVGLQFMPGLPGDTTQTIIETTEKVILLKPDFVRVYPTIVLKNTPLHKMYLSGSYAPWTLNEMTAVCRQAMKLLNDASITVIRVGLQPTKELEESIVAGPYHPSFRQLVEG